MQLVCKDIDGKSPWYYDPEQEVYQRFDSKGKASIVSGGKHTARVHGKFLPDPHELWKQYMARAGVKPGTGDALKCKPSPVTFALWAHWQKVPKPSLSGGENA